MGEESQDTIDVGRFRDANVIGIRRVVKIQQPFRQQDPLFMLGITMLLFSSVSSSFIQSQRKKNHLTFEVYMITF